MLGVNTVKAEADVASTPPKQVVEYIFRIKLKNH